MVKSDRTLQNNVQDELAFDPSIKANAIGVTVEHRVVTLRGVVESYAEKLACERAVKRVSGVHAFTDELEVDVPTLHRRDDRDIAAALVEALRWDVTVRAESIKAKVDEGFVILEGEADWQFEIDNVKRAVQHLTGVRGVISHIVLKPRVAAHDVTMKLEQTFRRSAKIDADRIQVEIVDGNVTLRGNVQSWSEYDDATRAAFSLPGVNRVDNLTNVF